MNAQNNKLRQDSLIQTNGPSVKVRDLIYKVLSQTKNIVYTLSLQAKQGNFADYEVIWRHVENSVRTTPSSL